MSPFDQVRDDLEEHAEACPEPAAYFLMTYAEGKFQVTAVADQNDSIALDIVTTLTKALQDDPNTEVNGLDVTSLDGVPRRLHS